MCAAATIKLRPYDLRHHGLIKLAEKTQNSLYSKLRGISHRSCFGKSIPTFAYQR